MPVYILREGVSNVFKIGRTGGDIDSVIRRLQTGNSQPLTVFDRVDTDRESACEAFFHRRLRSKRKTQGGGREFFEMSSDEMRSAIEQFRRMFGDLEESSQYVAELSNQQSSDAILEPTGEDHMMVQRLVRLKEEREYIDFECQLIEARLKRRIGTTSGLRGIASWKTQVRKMYDDKLFRDADPDRYNELLEKYYRLDTTAWKRARPDEYEAIRATYYSPTVCRTFKLQI